MLFGDDVSDLIFIRDELLMREMDPWDKMILVYLAYVGYLNFNVGYYSCKYLMGTLYQDLSLMQQFMQYYMLMYSMINVNLCYKYFLLKTYSVNKEVARRIYNKYNKYFDFFKTTCENLNQTQQQQNYQEETSEQYTRYNLNYEENLEKNE